MKEKGCVCVWGRDGKEELECSQGDSFKKEEIWELKI